MKEKVTKNPIYTKGDILFNTEHNMPCIVVGYDFSNIMQVICFLEEPFSDLREGKRTALYTYANDNDCVAPMFPNKIKDYIVEIQALKVLLECLPNNTKEMGFIFGRQG